MPQSLFLKRGQVKGKQKPILVYVPTEWIGELDALVKAKIYANRNEALLQIHNSKEKVKE